MGFTQMAVIVAAMAVLAVAVRAAPACTDYSSCFDCAANPFDVAGGCTWCGGNVQHCGADSGDAVVDNCAALGGLSFDDYRTCNGINSTAVFFFVCFFGYVVLPHSIDEIFTPPPPPPHPAAAAVDCTSVTCGNCDQAELRIPPVGYYDSAHSNYLATDSWEVNHPCVYHLGTAVVTGTSLDSNLVSGTYELDIGAQCNFCSQYVYADTNAEFAPYGGRCAAGTDFSGPNAALDVYLEDNGICPEAVSAANIETMIFKADETVVTATTAYLAWTAPHIGTNLRSADAISGYLLELQYGAGGAGWANVPPTGTVGEIRFPFLPNTENLEGTDYHYRNVANDQVGACVRACVRVCGSV